MLEAPRCADDLYFARAAEDPANGVTILRPAMTGDVFKGVDIPGVDRLDGDDEQLAMIVGHPCAIRSGWQLKPKVQMIRVVTFQPVDLRMWPKGYYDVMPLPDLTVIPTDDLLEEERLVRVEEGAHAGLFEQRGSVETSTLDPVQRIACLSEAGVAFVHQRMGHADTRFAPRVEDLMTACEAAFIEMELLETWNQDLVDQALLDDPVARRAELDRVAKLFDDALSERRPLPGKKDGRYVLRDDLGRQRTRAGARRTIAALLSEIVRQRAQAG